MDQQKQQVVEKLNSANNVLVTVSTNPSVDQLAACIGLTLLLNKMGKHATAVFSGTVPSTLQFLKPEETLEKNTDSLRDFIIAIDKNKADKLRYKVEDEVVKIFITPYKHSINEKDLIYSQGDFNVDVVVALGVAHQQDIDAAIVAHGRILHDAVVASITTGGPSDLGTLNWVGKSASGVSELAAALAIDLARDQLDKQISTALLTGVVAATDHFGNVKTSPQTMTVSAVLLAAGANQQLVAAQLAPKPQPQQPKSQPKPNNSAPKPSAGDGSDGGPLRIDHQAGGKNKNKKPGKENGPGSSGVITDSFSTQPADGGVSADEASLEEILQQSPASAPETQNMEETPAPIEEVAADTGPESPAETTDTPEESPAPAEPLTLPEPVSGALEGMPPFEPTPSEPADTGTTTEEAVSDNPELRGPTPEAGTHETLSEIEESVHSPHVPSEAAPEAEITAAPASAEEAPAASDDVIDSARQAVEEALESSPAASDFTTSAPELTPMPTDFSPAEPSSASIGAPASLPDYLTTPAMTPAPASPESAAPDSGYAPQPQMVSPTEGQSDQTLPPNPAVNEQAPLAGSPADQPFTMPLPPAGPGFPPSVGTGLPPIVPPTTPPSPTNLPPQGPPPPPAPPPIVPHGF